MTKIYGTSGNDNGNKALVGTGGGDEIHGGSGTDDLYGLEANDVLLGGSGPDRLYGGSGYDTASYTDALGSGVTVNLGTNVNTGGDAQGDKFYSIEGVTGSSYGDDITGNAQTNILKGEFGSDWLFGKAGNDSLYGGYGVDHLFGGAGADNLTGGADADLFSYQACEESTDGSRDTIWNFSKAEGDRIHLSAIDAKAHTDGNQSFSFIGHDDFTAEGQVRFFFQNGNTYVEANAYGDTEPDMLIMLSGTHNLGAYDFVL
ncbi:calcium-binding protein [Arenibaculum pallidiluteum]|uniref:calcium-binding protein n=1 Tax=Arenibaculum pallidiluteum TaxID=2812559 RepID=UPI001A96EAB7|nr:hypothetical protein [Arenibaculum pallidiluteum]